MRRFEGKVVIVTGAASGIGAATARRFASEGAMVALIDREEVGLAKVAKELAAERTLPMWRTSPTSTPSIRRSRPS